MQNIKPTSLEVLAAQRIANRLAALAERVHANVGYDECQPVHVAELMRTDIYPAILDLAVAANGLAKLAAAPAATATAAGRETKARA